MDKTTTWLVRGAAIVVIIVGWVSYLEPYLEKQEQIKLNRDSVNNSLSAKQRCKDFPKISESEFYDLYQKGLIKKAVMEANLPIQINTKKGNYLTDFYADKYILNLFAKKNIPMVVGSSLMCKQ